MEYFFIGIKGSGMRALVKFLIESGNTVEGYDDNKTKECSELLGVKLYNELSSEILQDKHIIVTPAISIDSLKKKFKIDDCLIQYYNEFVGDLTKNLSTISVSGSFGKTTTTCFLAQILDAIRGCSYIIGDGTGHYTEKSRTLVLESCEFKRHFLEYSPEDLIITNIGLEHLDCYKDFDDIVKTFIKFCNACNGLKVIYGDMKNVNYDQFLGDTIFYGLNERNDVIIKTISISENETKIDINYNSEKLSITIPLILGKHQVLDLVAAIIMSNHKGCSMKEILSVIKNLHLPKDRIVKKVIQGIPVICDVAVHYKGIENTLAQVRAMYPNRKLHVIFEPRSYDRMKNTCDLVCKALNKADFVYICDIVPVRETNPEKYNFSTQDILEKLNNAIYYNGNSKLYFDDESVVAILAYINMENLEKSITRILYN